MKENNENRIFTGNDAPMTTEQVGNLIKSPEYGRVQTEKIKHMFDAEIAPQLKAENRFRSIMASIDLIKKTKDGALLAGVLKLRFVGKSHKQIAKVIIKSTNKSDLPVYLTSMKKAIKFVEHAEIEAKHRVQEALNKPIIIPGV